MDSVRFDRVLWLEQVGGDVHMVANLQIGEVRCQAIVLIPYEDPVKAKVVASFMARAVRLEQAPRCVLREGGKPGA